MAEQRLEQAAEKTMAIVRSIAGHPDVSVEEAGELLLLAGQRLEAARAMSGLNQFSPTEIETAKQFISSLEPAARSRVEGFETVQKVLDHYQQMINFTQADEAIIQKVLEGSGITYSEPLSIKVGEFIRQLGYKVGSIYTNPQYEYLNRYWWESGLFSSNSIAVGNGGDQESKKVIQQNWFGRSEERIISTLTPIFKIGEIDLIRSQALNKNDWLFRVNGRAERAHAIVISKYLYDNFNKDIELTLSKE